MKLPLRPLALVTTRNNQSRGCCERFVRKHGKWSAHRSVRAYVERDRSLRMRRHERIDRAGCVSKYIKTNAGSVLFDTTPHVYRTQPGSKGSHRGKSLMRVELRDCGIRVHGPFRAACVRVHCNSRCSTFLVCPPIFTEAQAQPFWKLNCNSHWSEGIRARPCAYVLYELPFWQNEYSAFR